MFGTHYHYISLTPLILYYLPIDFANIILMILGNMCSTFLENTIYGWLFGPHGDMFQEVRVSVAMLFPSPI